MAIEITQFAKVNISVSPTGVQSGNFGILGFLTKASDLVLNPIPESERGRSYTSIESVAEDWAVNSETYLAAQAFYSQTPTPTDFVVLINYDSTTSAALEGGNHSDLATLQSTSQTDLSVDVDGVVTVVPAIDLSTAVDLPAVAAILQTSIRTASAGLMDVVYDGTAFIMTSELSGAVSLIGFASGGLAGHLGWTQDKAVISIGLEVETPVASLAAVKSAGIDFVGLVTTQWMRDVLTGAIGENVTDIALWCETNKKIFCNTSNDLNILKAASTGDVASMLMLGSYRFTMTTFSRYNNLYPSATAFGRVASVNFAAVNSTITLNLKQMPGVTAEDLSPSEFAVLRSKNASAVVRIGKSVNAFTDSRMASGSWLDTTHGLLWLENRVETDMFNLLYQSSTKVPYTQTGINITRAQLERSLDAAVRNGLAAPGFLPDGTYLPEGYRVISLALGDVPAADKSNRTFKGHSFDMVGSGAMHELIISGSFSE